MHLCYHLVMRLVFIYLLLSFNLANTQKRSARFEWTQKTVCILFVLNDWQLHTVGSSRLSIVMQVESKLLSIK